MSEAGQGGAPIFFFAPFVSSPMRVEPGWIDYNGHLNMAYYHVLFDRALDEALEVVGFGPAYVEEREASIFTAETHTLYRRELTLEDTVRITVQLIDFDEKRFHLYSEIRHAEEGWVSATCENLTLHVDMTTRKVTPFPGDILVNLAVMRAAHNPLTKPPVLGRVIGLSGTPRPTEKDDGVPDTRH